MFGVILIWKGILTCHRTCPSHGWLLALLSELRKCQALHLWKSPSSDTVHQVERLDLKMVFCNQNCSDLHTMRKKCSNDREKLLKFETEGQEFQNFWDHLNNLFKLWKVRTISGKGSFTNYVYKRRGVGGPKKSWTFYWFWFLPEEKPLLSWVSLFQKLVQNMNLWTPQMNTNINQVHICNVKCTLELIKQFVFVSPHM
jgi:hypothetical protein